MNRLGYGLLVILSLASCMNQGERKAAAIINHWQGKEIVYPENAVFVNLQGDTLRPDLMRGRYKILSYVDSIGCVSCDLDLSGWKEFLSVADSVSDGKVDFQFVFNPRRINELRLTLKSEQFNYPVCIDKEKNFDRKNHFPGDRRFCTFLLDSVNRVLAVGNPVQNTYMRNLYLNAIQGKATPPVIPEEKHYAEISVPETEADFGTCDWEKEHTAVFKIRNTGQTVLVVHGVETTCGCLDAEYTQEPVRPGGEAEVRLTYKATQTGYFRKLAMVRCNTKEQLLRLYVTGEAE